MNIKLIINILGLIKYNLLKPLSIDRLVYLS